MKGKVSKVLSRDEFKLVEVEKLSIEDEFMMWEPQTSRETTTKELITKAITKGVKNFYRPTLDLSFSKNGKDLFERWEKNFLAHWDENDSDEERTFYMHIAIQDTLFKKVMPKHVSFKSGYMPAIGKSYYWWVKFANQFMPQYNSRLGTSLEYGAFLGVLMKEFVESGKSVAWAWNAVCNDSKELGNYMNTGNVKRGFEPTGSRCVCGCHDLANTYKILGDSPKNNKFLVASGCYLEDSKDAPIARISSLPNPNIGNYYSTGWIVCSESKIYA